jgi:hypothetical protein
MKAGRRFVQIGLESGVARSDVPLAARERLEAVWRKYAIPMISKGERL